MYTFSLVSWLIPRRGHTIFLSLPDAKLALFRKSVIDFHVNVGFSGEGASQVGERIIHTDVWLVIGLHPSRCMLGHDFCFRGADGKTTHNNTNR